MREPGGKVGLHQAEPSTSSIAAQAGGEQGGLNEPFYSVAGRDLLRSFELGGGLYYVSRLTVQQVPSYAGVDLRVGWRPTENIELSFGGQNLLQGRHPEYLGLDTSVVPKNVIRSSYGKLTWRF